MELRVSKRKPPTEKKIQLSTKDPRHGPSHRTFILLMERSKRVLHAVTEK